MEIRNECLVALGECVPVLKDLAYRDDTAPTIRLSAIEKLMRIGLTGRKSVLMSNSDTVDLAVQVGAKMFRWTRGQERRFIDRLVEEAEALGDGFSDRNADDEADSSAGED